MKHMQNTIHTLTILLMFNATVFAHNHQHKTSQATTRVLIVDGFNNHDWQRTTRAITDILQEDKSLIINVATMPAMNSERWQNWHPQFHQYDVVIQNTNDLGNDQKWPEPVQKSLESFIANGGGLLAYHSANNAFIDWHEYNRMIGLGWRDKDFGPAIIIKKNKLVFVPAGEGEKTSHGKRYDALITRLAEHPIYNGLPKQWKAADIEVYRYARRPAENMTVLSYARDKKTGLDFPTEWLVQYGKGHVYCSTFGHFWPKQKIIPPGMRCIGFRTITTRVVKWLGGAKVNANAPENFPSKDAISLIQKQD